jgi:hypothetical protein
LLVGCDDRAGGEAGAASARAGLTPSPPVAWRGALADGAAFDLVPHADGAALVWAGRELKVQALDADGKPRAEPQTVHSLRAVREVAAASGGDRLAIVWRDGRRTLGTVGRGALALAASPSGRIVALLRGVSEACADRSERDCVEFFIRELPTATGSRPRLAVPRPCSRGAVGLAVVDGLWHYAVCSRQSGFERTTLFSARPEPAYAQAQPLLDRCVPRELTVLRRDVWLSGDCGGRRVALHIDGVTPPGRARDLGKVALRCRGAEPHITTPGARGLDLALREPRGRLAPLLPERLASDRARAAWTGRTLLIAEPGEQQLALRRHICSQGRLVSVP